MKKTLVMIFHPDIGSSKVNRRWITELEKYPQEFRVHEVYKACPHSRIDVPREQALIEEHEVIVFQFPLYWFSSPPLFKQWQDEVLSYGWAYGRNSGFALRDKRIALSISAGAEEREFGPGGLYRYTLAELTAPLEVTFHYVKADYRPLFAFYGAGTRVLPEQIEQGTADYLAWLRRLSAG
ncbi:MAG: NAD(P)H-dependent oxidoreductase [Mucilaginibacter polytrichastri]|nr:NAD(P)H-dependent oxidoreductase [Mucilaginibacter polytrichastri]